MNKKNLNLGQFRLVRSGSIFPVYFGELGSWIFKKRKDRVIAMKLLD